MYKLTAIFVSLLFIYLAVHKVDFSESVRVLGTVQFAWLPAAVLVYLFAYLVRALRWRRILRAQKTLSLREMIVPVLVGQMANNLLPARTGELYRAHFLGRRARMSRSGAVGSIVVERTFDGLMLVCLTMLVFLLFPQTWFLGAVALSTGLVFVTLAAGILFYDFAVDKTHRVINRGFGMMPQKLGEHINHRLEAFLRGIRGVSTVGGYLEAGVYTILIWSLEIITIALVIISFGVILPPGGYLLVFALAAFSITLPSGPGYTGPYQYAFILGLGLFAVSPETALAVSVAAQLALLGPITILGLVLLCIEQLRTELPLPRREKSELKDDHRGKESGWIS